MNVITFNTKGHDDFIDFLKAYAIICVLFGHTFLWLDKVGYCIWAGMQVPLFILIQVFHAYKKESLKINIKRIIQRVLLPFFSIELVTFGLSVIIYDYDFNELIHKGLVGGGYGPGAYYPWIYLQVSLLLPLFGLLLKKSSKSTSLILFLVICEGFEVLLSLVDFSDQIYRILCIRYIFLFYLGWLWVKKGILINWQTIFLSIISLVSIIYFDYYSINDEPWFFTTSWKYHRWPCYYFVANGFIAILHWIYVFIKRYSITKNCIEILSKSSYEIFLIQMSLIWLFRYNTISFITSILLKYVIWLFVIWSVSIFGGILLNRIINKNKSPQSTQV